MISSKAKLLILLREKQGEPVSGQLLAKKMAVSRVSVWKAVQSLLEAGYSIETNEKGYLLDPKNEKDFLYPWEFGERENLFFHYKNTPSTMDRAREIALSSTAFGSNTLHGSGGGFVFTAEKQSCGRGRNGRTWISKQGGLFFSILERPNLTIADYSLYSIIMQIAAAKAISAVCGKKSFVRWPNDIYINKKKIAGVTTEIAGEGDLITWLTGGIGVNINNPSPAPKAVSCHEITGKCISRKSVLEKILEEIEITKKKFASNAIYSQGNKLLCDEWNSLSDGIGAKTAVFKPEAKEDANGKTGKVLARGVFEGIDPKGRCILKTKDKKLYFNQGSVSLAFLNP